MHRKRSSSSVSSVDLIFSNGDLLTGILLFVPATSLIRLQLVNKHWRSIISSKPFHQLHTLHHRHRPTPQPSFLLCVNYDVEYFICHPTNNRLVPFRFNLGFPRIVHSCNGLLLLESRNSRCGRKAYYVFNPTTMQSRNLFLEKTYSGICLLFDPSKSPHYKVVCFERKEGSTCVLVYDSESHKWNKGGEFQKGPLVFRDGVYWNGGIFFIRSGNNSCCFFIGDENICSIPDPPRINRSPAAHCYHTMESNGHMHWIMSSMGSDRMQLYVYEFKMNGDESNWFFKYHVDLTQVLASFSWKCGMPVCLLGMIRGEREYDSILLFHVPGKIMIYRFVEMVFEVLVDLIRREGYCIEGYLQFDSKDSHPFIETLAPV